MIAVAEDLSVGFRFDNIAGPQQKADAELYL